MKHTAHQLTFNDFGHTLHHNQIESHDGNYLIFDTRNDDTKIGETQFIKILNTETLEIKTIYSTKNQSTFGPGVGAATFCPTKNSIIFIHGIRNANQENPYSATRRTGVSVDLNLDEKTIFMDARNIFSPYTKGALRGGTHSHSWKSDGKWISFTYNDFVLEQEAKINPNVKDQRVVGVMFSEKVEVPLDENLENNNGEMFSVIVSKVVPNPKNGSDEIEKAFDECWINGTNNIAFQGHVRNLEGKLKTEIYIATIPNKITITDTDNLQGSKINLPDVPKCITQKRITFTEKGISNFRHWLRSSPNGEIIYFLMEDNLNITQLFGVNTNDFKINQYTFLEKSIDSPFNISKDGNYAVFFSDEKIRISSLSEKKSELLYDSKLFNNKLTGIPHFSNNGKKIYFNQFVPNKSHEEFIQIFNIDTYFRI